MTLRLVILGVLLATGCGGTHHATPSEESEASPRTTGGSAGPLAPLRAPGAEPVLAALSAQPGDRSALARAATLYATSDVAGMTILWGIMYGGLGGDDTEHAAVAHAMMTALRDHVTMERDAGSMHMSTRLAPGSVPVIADGRSMRAPIAHLFELRVTTSLIGWSGTWTLASAAHVIVGLAHGSTPGTAGLESRAEILGWLAAAESAGVLEAFATSLLGPAFPEELAGYAAAHAAELDAARAFVAASPFVPTHAVLPDDLVTFP